MNPYARFGLVSNTLSATLTVSGLAIFGTPVIDAISQTAGNTGTSKLAALGCIVAVMVVFWVAMTEAIFPIIFRSNTVRKLVLGKYYIEGTWLQAERGDEDDHRLSVIDIQPDGDNFIISGYALTKDMQVESNTLIEFSNIAWPFMTYKYRNSLSDGADGHRDGVGEIQFEMNSDAARRFNGFDQYVGSNSRLKIEGSKIVARKDVRELRTLEGRREIFEKYWELFFNESIRKVETVTAPVVAPGPIVEAIVAPVAAALPVAEAPAPIAEPTPVAEDNVTAVQSTSDLLPATESIPMPTPAVERREADQAAEGPVVPRRRATDWKLSDDTNGPLLKDGDQPVVIRDDTTLAVDSGNHKPFYSNGSIKIR